MNDSVTPTYRRIRGTWRRRLFAAWIVASAAVAAWIAIAGPFARFVAEDLRPFVALSLPAVMFFMLVTGFAWLMALTASNRHTEPTR